MGPKNINLLKPGYLLHWYRIDTVLGQGGFGITYLAEDQNLQEKVAIKEYYPSQFATRTVEGSVQQLSEEHTDDYQWGLDRFISEARTLTQFRHPSIVRVRNVFEENNTAYMVMDFEEGETLGSKLKGKQTLSEEALLSLFLPLMEGLEVVHESGFIHRDIKPDNIVVKKDGCVLIDFGSARRAVGERSVAMTQITSAGYAPFEQYHSKGDKQGPWTDIYAMGATLYRAVTGIAPSQAMDRSNALHETTRDTYIRARELCGDACSDHFLAAIDHALEFRATERPRSVAEWRAELQGDDRDFPDSESPTGLVKENVGEWSAKEQADIRKQLEQVLASTCFTTAPQLQRLLTYLVDETLAGRGERLNQASIAIDVLGKDAEFDAAIDSVVRVEARRLRSRLIEYYYGDGKEDTIRFELPKGQYSMSITFDPVVDASGVVDSIKSVSYRVRSYSRRRFSDYFSLRKSFLIFIVLLAFSLLLIANNYFTRTGEEVALGRNEEQIQPAGTNSFALALNHKSVAVLPFANRSDEKSDVYFTDGLHDDLLTHLSKISDMKVISRTSMMAYRNTEKNMKTIGAELGVATLVQGAVQRAGSQIHISVQLIDAQTDEHLWAEIYDRELTAVNIFTIQAEIATAIAGTLQATLSPEEHERIAAVPTKNLAAYDAYLLGRERLAKRTKEALSEAVSNFEKSIKLDPMFALSYAALADTYQLQVVHSGLPREQMLDLAEGAINTALALDDKSAEIYLSLGFYKSSRLDLDAAETAFRKALVLNPNYAITYSRYAELLRYTGRIEDAFKQMQKALELDPVSIVINMKVALYHLMLGRTDEAMALYDKMIEIDPTSHFGYFGKAEIYTFVYGQIDKAMPWYKKTISAYPDSPIFNAILGGIYLDLGDEEEATCWIDQGIKLGADYYWPNVAKALLHIYRGENEQALAFARQSLKIRPRGWAALQILRNDVLRAGNTTKARKLYENYYSSFLIESEPTVNSWNYKVAIDLAYVMTLTGEEDRAELLLERSLTAIRENKPDSDYGGDALTDVQVYAIQGHKQQALTALRKDIDAGWRSGWWYFLKHDPNLESIRGEVEFQSMLDEIKSDMDAQLARVKAMTQEDVVCINR